MKYITECQKCMLRNNQRPIIHRIKKAKLFWVGLSAKKVINPETDYPLNSDTNTGKLLDLIEEKLLPLTFYRTNLVKCLPLDERQKIRYPSNKEMSICIDNLIFEIQLFQPRIIFLLGDIVYENVSKTLFLGKDLKRQSVNFKFRIAENNDSIFIGAPHPSYVHIYKRKYFNEYIEKVVELVVENCENLSKLY